MPILPMVLVNGSSGIGTGWSSEGNKTPFVTFIILCVCVCVFGFCGFFFFGCVVFICASFVSFPISYIPFHLHAVPTYNPVEIVANLKRMMDGEQPQAMSPWYRDFKGSVTTKAKDKFLV